MQVLKSLQDHTEETREMNSGTAEGQFARCRAEIAQNNQALGHRQVEGPHA